MLLAFVPAIPGEENLIEWNESRKLTWDDFRGKPDPDSPNAALTNSAINLEFGYNNTGLTYSIKCRFNKSLSWVRMKTDYILNHEQGHFDIAEAHARMLHKELAGYRFNSRTVGKDVNGMYSEVMEKHVDMQKAYDIETMHSIDSAQQRVWDDRIAGMLNEYSKYAGYGAQKKQ